MLEITISDPEMWDEIKEEFVIQKEQTIQLEHSLISLSKWESKWHKPFLTKEEKTLEETIDYIKCMTLTPNVPSDAYFNISAQNVKLINQYIQAPMTATTFHNERPARRNGEMVTAELIYYWMTVLNIPFECQEWHLNRLLTLIKLCSVKNAPSKKMSRRDILSQNAALNAARRRKLHTKG